MSLRPASAADLSRVAALVNGAYRGESARRGWTHEADLLEGQRTDEGALAAGLRESPGARILLLEEEETLKGCVWLDPPRGGQAMLGMLTVRPDLQAEGLGRRLLEAAEAEARAAGAARIQITVIATRAPLIAWYERRGYRRTGARKPFPVEDPSVGRPLSRDLFFLVLEKSL